MDPFLFGIATNLATDFLKATYRGVRDLGSGGSEKRALKRTFTRAFGVLVTAAAQWNGRELTADLAALVEDQLRLLVTDPVIAEMLLKVALDDDDLDLQRLHTRFEELGFDPDTFLVDFDATMTRFQFALTEELREAASAAGSPLFNRVAMAKLESLVKGLQNTNFGIAAVPISAAVRDPGPVFTAVDVAAFTGRDWLAREVDGFTATNPCGYVFLEGEAGLGKTAFAAWLVKTRGYLSHFSRHSGGQSVQMALQNLSAQLILEFELGDLTPDGMLPDWMLRPTGFEFLLNRAGERAHDSGRSLVLVVDGLDEAETVRGSLPFGLPKLLPLGVYIVATYRTGWSPGQPSAPSVVVQLRKDDPRNVADIHQFLTIAAGEKTLAAYLVEAGVEPGDFVGLLSKRCDGVWVYLRYVLDELRMGLRRPDAIGDLPVGLHGYYADQIRQWRADPLWEDFLLPLLATLGTAAEPLPANVLSRLAGGLNIQEVRRLCDLVFRPLLTAVRTGPGTRLKYEIYHASFRQVLGADYSDAAALPGGLPFELEALADELRQATVAAHSRAADIYLHGFGGLGKGLPELAAHPAIAGVDDGYPLRHLTRHLQHADRVADLQQLLVATGPPSGDRASNVWFTAHDAAGTLINYLDDLARALSTCAAVTDQAIACKEPAPALGTEIRYTLMAASIASRAARISSEMMSLLIRTGLWSPERGLDQARHLAQPISRSQALMAVCQYMTGPARSAVGAEAIDAALAIDDDCHRADTLTQLATIVPAEQQTSVLAHALDAAMITDDVRRPEALRCLAQHLTEGQLARALDAAISISTDFNRARALSGMAPHLTKGQLARALDAAIAMTSVFSAEALVGLAPHLTVGQLRRAIDVADNFERSMPLKAQVLASLAAGLPSGERSQVLRVIQANCSLCQIYPERRRAHMKDDLFLERI